MNIYRERLRNMGKFYRRKTLKTGETMDDLLNRAEHQKQKIGFQKKSLDDHQIAIQEQQKAIEMFISDQK